MSCCLNLPPRTFLDGEGTTPDCWQIVWEHFADMIAENLPGQLGPYADKVLAVARSIELPPELDGLFGVITKFERGTLPKLTTYDS